MILDENAEAAGGDYFSLGAFEVSPDHRLLAWSSDRDGSERYTLRVRDLTTGADLADELHDTHLGRRRLGGRQRHRCCTSSPTSRCGRSRCGATCSAPTQDADTLVFEDLDERFFVGVGLTRSGEWIVIECESKRQRRGPADPAADTAADAASSCASGSTTSSTRVDHWGDRFVVVTNLDAEDFRVMTAPVDAPGEWTELVAHEPGRRITSRRAVRRPPRAARVARRPDRGCGSCSATAPSAPSSSATSRTTSSSTPTPSGTTTDVALRATSRSPRRPSVYEEDVRTGERTLLKQTPVPNADLSRYTARRGVGDGATTARRCRSTWSRRADLAADGSAPVPGLRLRQLRDLGAAVVQPRPAVAARPRRGVGARPPPRRRRARPAVVPRRQAAAQAQHVHRHDRRAPSTSSPRAGRRPGGSPSAAAAPAGCSSARA